VERTRQGGAVRWRGASGHGYCRMVVPLDLDDEGMEAVVPCSGWWHVLLSLWLSSSSTELI
jgi:hypothetical protein